MRYLDFYEKWMQSPQKQIQDYEALGKAGQTSVVCVTLTGKTNTTDGNRRTEAKGCTKHVGIWTR